MQESELCGAVGQTANLPEDGRGRDDRERSQELGFEFERRASSDSEREGTVEMKLIFRTAWTRSHRLNGGHSIPESGAVICISLATRWE